ncbi:MAG TPA: sensor histidine kinase [Solirubrobacteraceae bacterium]|nr:sensor histidine kinase [Solirubrobacteraceae bacterium]
MVGLRRALLALFAVGVLFAGLAVALTLTSDHDDQKAVTAILGPVIGLSFIGTGVFAWWRRPLNRFGLLMCAVGFAWFLASLAESNDPTFFTIGAYLSPLYVVLVIHMVLAFPTGRLETPAARAIAIAGYVVGLLVTLPFFLLGGEIDAGENAPDNAFEVLHEPGIAQVFLTLTLLGAVAVAAATVAVLLRKRRVATPPQRRAQAPMLWIGLTVMTALGLSFLADAAGLPEVVVLIFSYTAFVAFAILPFAFLTGLVRTRYSRAGAVGGLVERLNEPDTRVSLREALADALGDPTLQLVYWRPSAGHYVTYEGHRAAPPGPDSGRAVAQVERDGKRVGAIVHDAALRDDPTLLRAAAAAAALQLENERLEAELRARVEELQSSRARLVEVSMFERRRLERDLHDGAQQRLVALSLQLGLARRKVEQDPFTGARLLDEARVELERALEELRELARGIHPAVLTDRGLEPAVQALAARAPVPVDVEAMPTDRLPAAVEAAAYFVVAESLTNVAKYAQAERASVRVGREDGFAVVEVSDDGVGGADPAGGSGLRGLTDRLAALDGRLEVHSPPGGGTVVRANIPCSTCA